MSSRYHESLPSIRNPSQLRVRCLGMTRRETDLAFGDAFSAGSLVDEGGECMLPFVLKKLKENEGHTDAFDRAMANQFYPDSSDPITTAKNVRLGMKNYGLVDQNGQFTDVGEELYSLRNNEEELYRRLAEHILLELDGIKVIDIIRDLQLAGEQTTTSNIYRELDRQYDIYVHEGSTHWNQMRGWLSEADLINTNTPRIDVTWEKVDEVVGVNRETRLKLSGLSEAQQAFLKTLASLDPDEPIPNNEIRDLAEKTHGVYIDHKSTTADILDPLADAGFIEYESTVEVTGKPSVVEPTDKFETEVMKPVLENVSEHSGVPHEVLRQSFDEIREQMESDDTHIKGRALEALAVKIGSLLDLDFVDWQLRGVETGGAEVDVVMDSIAVNFSRWQIQCKNTDDRIRTKHVAKEVGLSRMLQTNVILMIGRSGVVPDARRFAKKIMRDQNLTILFLTGDDLDEMNEHPSYLTDTLGSQTSQIQRLKTVNTPVGVANRPESTDESEKEDKSEDTSLDDF